MYGLIFTKLLTFVDGLFYNLSIVDLLVFFQEKEEKCDDKQIQFISIFVFWVSWGCINWRSSMDVA
jgi:hypothetical protein